MEFHDWVQINYFTRKDFSQLRSNEVTRLLNLIELCPTKNEYDYNKFILTEGKKLLPELVSKKDKTNQRIIDCLIIQYFNFKIKG